MNIDKLYRYEADGTVQTFCKLCDAHLDFAEHAEDCPGRVLEALQYEIHVEGPNCARSCCGYTDTRVDGPSFEAIAEDAVRAGSDAIRVRYAGRVFADVELPSGLIAAAAARIQKREEEKKAAEKAQREAEERAAAHQAALAQLEQDRPDLSEEGYARRKAQIEKEYGPWLKTS